MPVETTPSVADKSALLDSLGLELNVGDIDDDLEISAERETDEEALDRDDELGLMLTLEDKRGVRERGDDLEADLEMLGVGDELELALTVCDFGGLLDPVCNIES